MDREIIHNTLENLHQTSGIEGFWRQSGPLDGIMELNINGQKIAFLLEIKNEVRPHQLPQLQEYFQKHENFILLANRIFPKVKKELQLREIPYLEVNGNFFLKKGPIFLFIDTQKYFTTEKAKGNRAFTKTCLKVLFYLLQYKDAINLTQREMAGKAEVGLGNIPQVLHGLKETGFLIPLNKHEWAWGNRKELLERWITEYGTVLKPKPKKARYTYQGNWKEIALNQEIMVWGGEAAADILTDHLRPEKFILYTKESRTNLMKNYRLIPRDDGNIEVFEMFWRQDKTQQTAPTLLVYADLLLEGGKRNLETAELLMNAYVKPML